MKFIPIFLLTLVILVSFVPMARALAFPSLVNCGNQEVGPGEGGGSLPIEPCTLDDLWKLIARVVDFLLKYIGIPLAVFGIGVGGFRMIIGSNSASQREEGKKVVFASLIGLFIALSAWLIVNTILKGLGATNIKNPLEQKI